LATPHKEYVIKGCLSSTGTIGLTYGHDSAIIFSSKNNQLRHDW
jgi:hypothetical protein